MSDERDLKYKPDELPEQISRKLYVHYRISGYFAGQITVWEFENLHDAEHVVLCEVDTVIKLPKIDRNGLKSKALAVLEGEKQRVMAENHQRLQKVQEKIDTLLAIEYKPEAA